MPSSHRMMRMTAIVSSIVRLLGAGRGAVRPALSNGCATSPSITRNVFVAVVQSLAAILPWGGGAAAQSSGSETPTAPSTSEHAVTSTLKFLGGGAIGLAAHESGHLLFDGIFDANPSIKKVSFHGIPFFAITHDAGLSPRKEFNIGSGGFWVQEAANEGLPGRRPNL